MGRGVESGESVYALIPPPVEEVNRVKMYKSRFHSTAAVPPSCSTLGLQGSHRVISNEGGDADVYGRSVAARDRAVRKGATVKRTEKPVMGLVTDKDFVRENAREIIHTAATRRPEPEAPAVEGAEFGKVPGYLKRVKAQVNAEKEMMTQMQGGGNQGNTMNRMHGMDDTERQELIAGLRKRWEEVHKQYQKLTFNIDTVAKVQKKESLEVEMEQIEKSIQKLSKKNLFVYEDTLPPLGYGNGRY